MGETVDEQERILGSLWEPHPAQRAIMERNERFRIVACGRRWGKSEMTAHLALEHALEHTQATVWWVAPTYEQSNSYGFDKIKPLLSSDITVEPPRLSKPREISLVTGSELSFRSAEREDSLRGGGVDFLVLDEAGAIPDRAWVEELRPTLSDTEGDMLAIGTPKRRNWFYKWFQRGSSEKYPDVVSFQAPTETNPHIHDAEVESAREDMPDRDFKREYRAKFLDESGGVFTDLEARVLADYDPAYVSGEEPYSTGVDFARTDDYTVIVTLDASGRLVHFDRVRGAGWPEIQRRVESTAASTRARCS
jgi:phage terminase large subunit